MVSCSGWNDDEATTLKYAFGVRQSGSFSIMMPRGENNNYEFNLDNALLAEGETSTMVDLEALVFDDMGASASVIVQVDLTLALTLTQTQNSTKPKPKGFGASS